MLIIDLRQTNQYKKCHLCTAINIPTPTPPLTHKELNTLKTQLYVALSTIPLDFPIGIYCKKGIRAQIALDMAQKFGFKNVFNLGGLCFNQADG